MTLMPLDFPTKEIIEGKARILVAKLEPSNEPADKLRSKAPVFYNPIQTTNRDTAILAVKALFSRVKHPLRVCEPMCGSGVRGIRLACEVEEVNHVVMGDLSPSAIKIAQINAERNDVSNKVKLRLLDANLLLSLHGFPGGRFDYVDIDPYGSPVTFMDSAIRSLSNNGLLALTATDMAPLCGVNPKACLRKYGGKPLHNEFCHETALRLLSAAAIKHAAVHEAAASPCFSYYADHYIRAYFNLESGSKNVNEKLSKIGYVKYCPRCLTRFTSPDCKKEKCEICGGHMIIGGPMWLGELAEQDFIDKMLQASKPSLTDSRATTIIQKVKKEIGFPPSFYDIDKLCSLARIKSIPTLEFIEKVSETGHKVTETHYYNRAIKTDATVFELKKILEN